MLDWDHPSVKEISNNKVKDKWKNINTHTHTHRERKRETDRTSPAALLSQVRFARWEKRVIRLLPNTWGYRDFLVAYIGKA